MDEGHHRQSLEKGLERLYRYPGYGPWDAKLWICGVEERGPTGDFDDAWLLAKEHPTDEQAPFTPGEEDRSSSAWRRSFELAARTFAGESRSGNGYPWLFADAWRAQAALLHLTNILVVPRQCTRDWGLTLLSRNAYERGIRERRVPILRERRPENSVVVCHQIPETRDHCIAAFVRGGEIPERVEAPDGRSFSVYRASRTVLCPFFRGNLMTNALFDMLCGRVADLLGPRGAVADPV